MITCLALLRSNGSRQLSINLGGTGAFSAYQTEAVQQIGGWQDVMGEDIVLTYQLLRQKLRPLMSWGGRLYNGSRNIQWPVQSTQAVGNRYVGGLSSVPPWKQGTGYARYFTFVNLSIIYLDLAFLFGLIPGIILAFFGFYYFAGLLTLLTVAISILLFLSMYLYQKKLGIPFQK